MTTLEVLSLFKKETLMEMYPNVWVALRIAATIPMAVATAESSPSKSKLLKIYRRIKWVKTV